MWNGKKFMLLTWCSTSWRAKPFKSDQSNWNVNMFPENPRCSWGGIWKTEKMTGMWDGSSWGIDGGWPTISNHSPEQNQPPYQRLPTSINPPKGWAPFQAARILLALMLADKCHILHHNCFPSPRPWVEKVKKWRRRQMLEDLVGQWWVWPWLWILWALPDSRDRSLGKRDLPS